MIPAPHLGIAANGARFHREAARASTTIGAKFGLPYQGLIAMGADRIADRLIEGFEQ